MTIADTIGFDRLTVDSTSWPAPSWNRRALRPLAWLCIRFGRRVIRALDLGGFAQLRHVIRLRLARHIGLDLGLDLLEIGSLAVALFLDLDDMPAELRLDRVGDLAGLHRESDGGKFRYHLVLGEEAEIATVRCAGILRFLLGQFGEVGALLQFVRDRLGLLLRLDENVPGVHFLLAGDLLGSVFIDLLHGVVGGGGLALDREQIVHQQAVAGEGEAGLEVVAVLDLFGFGGLGHDLHVDQKGQHIVLPGRRIHLSQARSQFLFGQGKVALADFSAVDLGENRVCVFSSASGQAGEQDHRQATGDGEGMTRAGFRFRERRGHGKSLP